MTNKKLQQAAMIVHLFDLYESYHSTGGSLHIISDDQNYGEGSDAFCATYASEMGDYWGETIATLLTEFTAEEQEQIFERPHEIMEAFDAFQQTLFS